MKHLLLLLIIFIGFNQLLFAQSWSDRPDYPLETVYEQDFTTNQWDGTLFYSQWDAVVPFIFSALDITNGYFQFEWINKRILRSKDVYRAPYVLEAEINYDGGSNRGGIVIRIDNDQGERVQEPAQGDPGFNAEGIAFYPTEEGDALIVQFTGVYEKNNTPVMRINVPKPNDVTSLKLKNSYRIEDYDSLVYVFLNDNPFLIIELKNKSESFYTSGNIYNSKEEKVGSFSGMEVKENGKVAICQRNASLKLYKAGIKQVNLESQTISFDAIGTKSRTDKPFKINAVASSGLPLTFSIVSGPAEVNDDTLKLSGKYGNVTVLASQSGNYEYHPASASQSFRVSDFNISSSSQDFVDNWVATDALGRHLPTQSEVGSKRNDKLVGVFYYIWNGAHGNKVYDITKILKNHPSAPLSDENTAWGPKNHFHFWGEPEYGYYHSQDPWVLRRDLHMLSNAKVDFVFFDVTNGRTYLDVVNAFCEMSIQMRAEGVNTPQIAFTTNKNPNTVNALYNEFYVKNSYEELWFMWDGKPLILGLKSDPAITPEAKAFFTFKYSWAWTKTKDEPNHWQWLDRYPQDYGWSTNSSIPEQITVSVAHHPGNPLGKSYHNGEQPEVNANYLTQYTGLGLQFAEQWQRALQVDPEVVMITQWNEWLAQRFIWDNSKTHYAGRPIKNGETHFVDVFTAEFNRDMAPMKGGYTDNYYYQMVANIRKYKGMAEPQVYSVPKKIDIDGDFSEWNDVGPVFKDPFGDTMHRNFKSYDPTTTYTNNTGRNDIIESKVTFDTNNVYFYVKTYENTSAYTDNNWMLLFIDIDKNKATGWEGYDYLINHSINSENETVVKQFKNDGWVSIGTAGYSVSQDQMEISVHRELMGVNDHPKFYFHWADNPQHLDDITCFFTDGESAPDRRFNFNYSFSWPTSKKNIGIDDQSSAIKIFPNPVNDVLNVEYSNVDMGKAEVRIFNSTGKKVIAHGFPDSLSEIDVSYLKAGMYMLEIIDEDITHIGRFIKN